MEHGATVEKTPAAVVKKCKYTIAMLSDPSAAISVSDLLKNFLCPLSWSFFNLEYNIYLILVS